MPPFRSWEAWKDEVFQLMLDSYSQVFGATSGQTPITRAEIDWEKWRPWHEAGLSAREAIEKSLVTA
jgi:hypothetical protein